MSEESLAAFFDQTLSAESKGIAEAHLATCDFCLGQLAFLARAEHRELPTVPAHLLTRVAALLKPEKKLALMRPAWQWALASAGVALLVIGVAMRPWLPGKTTPILVETKPSTVGKVASPPIVTSPPIPNPVAKYRKGEVAPAPPAIIEPQEGGEIALPAHVAWQPMRGSQFYEVEITQADGALLWSGRTENSEILIPAEAHLLRGESCFLRVRAYLAGGKTERYAPVSFRVKPSANR